MSEVGFDSKVASPVEIFLRDVSIADSGGDRNDALVFVVAKGDDDMDDWDGVWRGSRCGGWFRLGYLVVRMAA